MRMLPPSVAHPKKKLTLSYIYMKNGWVAISSSEDIKKMCKKASGCLST